MPLVDDHRYACKNCIKGHRTRTCDCFDQVRQKELLQRYSDPVKKFVPVDAQDVKVALFEKTMKSGRPSNEEATRNKETKTYYILFKVGSEGNQCRVAGKFDVDRNSERVLPPDEESGRDALNRSCCASTNPPQANGSGHRPMQPKRQSELPAADHLQFGPILSMNGTRPQHVCHCGSGCNCLFCPQHPATESTQRRLAETINQKMFPQNHNGDSTSTSFQSTQIHGCSGSTSSDAAITDSLQDALNHFPNFDSNNENLFIAQFNLMGCPPIPRSDTESLAYENSQPNLAGRPVSGLLPSDFTDIFALNTEAIPDPEWFADADLINGEPIDPEIFRGNYPWQGPP